MFTKFIRNASSSINPQNVYIVGAARTPIGSFRGQLVDVGAVQLGTIAVKSALERAKIDPSKVDEVFLGIVNSAGTRQAPAKQIALNSGMSIKTPTTSLSKMCASGMKSIMLGSQTLMLNHQKVVLAAGVESMSNTPYIIRRFNSPYGGFSAIDLLLEDGLLDAYNGEHMGTCTESVISKMGITRAQQDQYAILSYNRAMTAAKEGIFLPEIVPVELPRSQSMSVDEEPGKVKFDKIPNLKPAFLKEGGTITPANASKLNDGGAACVLASEDAVSEYSLTPIAQIIGFADSATTPSEFSYAPVLAIRKLLENLKIKIDSVAMWEINEAFSAVPLIAEKELGIDIEKLNIHGGAVALGHPIGMSGTRITNHLALNIKPGQLGVAAICNGGGGASAICLKGV